MLVCKYWTLVRLDCSVAWCKIVRTYIVFAYDNPDVIGIFFLIVVTTNNRKKEKSIDNHQIINAFSQSG